MKHLIYNFGITRFPNATPSSQSSKVREEIAEMYDEEPYTEKWWFEYADVYIAAVHGEERFNTPFCKFIVYHIETSRDFVELLPYVEKKMKINQERTWKGDKHVEPKKIIKHINYKTGQVIIEEV